MSWKPGRRKAAIVLEQPYEDVPGHLLGPLTVWLSDRLRNDDNRFFAFGIALRISIPDPRRSPYESRQAWEVVAAHIDASHDFLLDAIEWLLESGNVDYRTRDELAGILAVGNSMYCLRDDQRGLEERVTPEVKRMVQQVVDDGAETSAGDHLATAWNLAYGRTADPVKAYSEAIKAVEAAAAPVISPKHLKATLGTMIRDFEAKPSKWTHPLQGASVSGLDATLAMMKALWEGQTSRHGGLTQTRPESPAAARSAVHLAATLVEAFATSTVAPAS